jgi:hypothetical protein
VTHNGKVSISDLTRRLSLRGLAAAMKRCSMAFEKLSGFLDADVEIQEEFAQDAY